jgi:hypothetical protein
MNEEGINISKLKEFKGKFEEELNRVMKFWVENSHDTSNGYRHIFYYY